MLYPSIFYPNFLLNKLNKKIKSNKLVLGGQYITCPSNDKLVDELNGLIYDKSKSDKEQYIEKVIKAIKNTNFKLVNLMQIILFWHIETYIYFPNIKKILFIDSANHFDFCNNYKEDDSNAIYISSLDLSKIQNDNNCLMCATLNICLLSEYLLKDNNREILESIMKNSSQKNKSELVEFIRGMFNTENEILKKCVNLNYSKLSQM